MNSGEKVLWNVVNKIAWGSNDDNPPFRAIPREVFIELAQKAIVEYRNLTSRSSRAADAQAEGVLFGTIYNQ